MSTDQKRALLIVLVIVAVVVILAVGVGSLATAIGLPWWIAVILALVVTAVVGLFMVLNLI